jgi:mRNA interferase RelE/StbE
VTRYQVEIDPRAQRELAALARADKRRAVAVRAAVMALAEDPRPDRCRKLAGRHDLYRIRVGDFRILYRVADQVVTVTVVRVAKSPRRVRPSRQALTSTNDSGPGRG